MVKILAEIPAEYEADIYKYEPPDVNAVTATYAGPLMFVSMFAVTQQNQSNEMRKQLKALRKGGRSNVQYVRPRAYVEELGHEGASTQKSGTKDCDIHGTRQSRYHRCTGKQGGYPDMAAWDVGEFLYENLV
jgi:hypothetical protein